VKAINLIPGESRRSGVSPSLGRLGPAHAVLGLLVIVLAYVTVYVVTSNSISDHKAELASAQQQVSQVQAQITRLNSYAQFEKLAQERAATVRQIAATRFDWHGALSDLSKVVPANTSLQSLVATAASTTSGSGGASAGGSGGNVRGAINAPAFQLKGCTHTQDQVAQLMSRLRLVNGVTRVTLEDSTAQASGGTGAAVSSSAGSTGSSAGGCPANGPSFDMVVFFQPVSVAPITGATR
jgi:Tfp pilus assembly protein PilN